MENQIYRQELEAAQAHNRALLERQDPYSLTQELSQQYWSCLAGADIMAYLEIPSLNVTLPIAHGTEESTLQKNVGHLEWSSLPVGGESTHCVLSGHRGLPSSELFTNLDQLQQGDSFFIHVLGQTLTYRVDEINIVLPHEMELLQIEDGQDYVTLLTCTPYGINSHRLLVRGVREETLPQTQEVPQSTEKGVGDLARMLLIPAALCVLAVLLLTLGRKNKRKTREKEMGGKYEKR